MHLYYSLNKAKCIKFSDAGPHAEFYWTYRFYCENKEQDKSDSLIHQGFSSGCSIDDGYDFKEISDDVNEGQRVLNDPFIKIKLPELKEGETNLISMFLYCWESDHSTVETKKLFSNESAQVLFDIYKKNQEKKDIAQKEFKDWLTDSGTGDFLGTLLSSTSGTASKVFVECAKQLIKILDWAILLIKSNSDDYVGLNKTFLKYKKENGKYLYTWKYLTPNGLSSSDEGTHNRWILFKEDNLDNIIHTQVHFQIEE